MASGGIIFLYLAVWQADVLSLKLWVSRSRNRHVVPSLHVFSAESYVVRMGVGFSGLLSPERNRGFCQIDCFALWHASCVIRINGGLCP